LKLSESPLKTQFGRSVFESEHENEKQKVAVDRPWIPFGSHVACSGSRDVHGPGRVAGERLEDAAGQSTTQRRTFPGSCRTRTWSQADFISDTGASSAELLKENKTDVWDSDRVASGQSLTFHTPDRRSSPRHATSGACSLGRDRKAYAPARAVGGRQAC